MDVKKEIIVKLSLKDVAYFAAALLFYSKLPFNDLEEYYDVAADTLVHDLYSTEDIKEEVKLFKKDGDEYVELSKEDLLSLMNVITIDHGLTIDNGSDD